MGRIGQPGEIATSYVFLASEDSAFMSGQVFHPNGGSVVSGAVLAGTAFRLRSSPGG